MYFIGGDSVQTYQEKVLGAIEMNKQFMKNLNKKLFKTDVKITYYDW